MSSHVSHRAMPTYHEAQVWTDGCPECKQRANDLPYSVLTLDNQRLRLAWRRAYDWQYGDRVDLHLSQTELPLLRLLWVLQLVLERQLNWPLGVFLPNVHFDTQRVDHFLGPGGPDV